MIGKHASNESVSNRKIDDCPVIDLNDQEFRIAEHLAAARTISYSEVDDGPLGDQDQYHAHLTGVLGEMAAAKAMETSIDDRIYARGDAGEDLQLGGYDVDVKTTSTRVRRPDLLVRADREHTADVYILAHRIDQRQIRLLGWIDRETVTKREPEQFPAGTPNYVVPIDELGPLATLEWRIRG